MPIEQLFSSKEKANLFYKKQWQTGRQFRTYSFRIHVNLDKQVTNLLSKIYWQSIDMWDKSACVNKYFVLLLTHYFTNFS